MSLSDLMGFDHVIRVHADGRITDASGIWAPDLNDGHDGQLDEYAHIGGQPTGWSLMNGYSGQYGYSGPIMHPSEFIGGRMERDIRTTPGIYVALVNSVSEPCDGCESCAGSEDGGPCDVHDIDGWAVAHIADSDHDSTDPDACSCGHADYPHEPGTLYDCAACEAHCYAGLVRRGACVHCAITKEGK